MTGNVNFHDTGPRSVSAATSMPSGTRCWCYWCFKSRNCRHRLRQRWGQNRCWRTAATTAGHCGSWLDSGNVTLVNIWDISLIFWVFWLVGHSCMTINALVKIIQLWIEIFFLIFLFTFTARFVFWACTAGFVMFIANVFNGCNCSRIISCIGWLFWEHVSQPKLSSRSEISVVCSRFPFSSESSFSNSSFWSPPGFLSCFTLPKNHWFCLWHLCDFKGVSRHHLWFCQNSSVANDLAKGALPLLFGVDVVSKVFERTIRRRILWKHCIDHVAFSITAQRQNCESWGTMVHETDVQPMLFTKLSLLRLTRLLRNKPFLHKSFPHRILIRIRLTLNMILLMMILDGRQYCSWRHTFYFQHCKPLIQ